MVAYVPPKQAGKYKAVASGAITNGKPVIVNTAWYCYRNICNC